jgi:uncharacterized membrane protein YfcA
VAIAFLNTVFSAPTTSQDKGHAALFLALTFAPLAVAGLLLAPLLDRAGPRRTISFASAASRSVLAIYLAPRLGTLAFFPLAFLMLVCVKIEVITKNSLTVAYADEERKLVQANARLGVWSVVCAMIGAGIGALALKLSGGMAVLYSASVVYVASAFLNLRLPHPRAPKRERTVVNKLGRIPELRIASAGRIGLGVAQGFLILLLGFSLRESHEPTWWSYLLAGAALLGGVVGDLIVPRLPSWIREEAGVGLHGRVGGRDVLITNRAHAKQFELPPSQPTGLECIIVIDGRYAAVFRFHDVPRSDSRGFVNHLAPKHGFTRVLLVSGDRESEVRRLAAAVAITSIHAETSPEEKVRIVRDETRQAKTLFIGDDVTDESVFAIMPDLKGIAFSVGRRARGVAGHFDAPSDVREFLAHLLDDERDASLP